MRLAVGIGLALLPACAPRTPPTDNAAAVQVDAAPAGDRSRALASALNALLLDSTSATTVLERWCGQRHIAMPAVIVAQVERGADAPASADTLARLRARPDEVAHRRVRLMCGEVVLSVAENWYVPGRLSPAMRTDLTGGTPFGKVIRPLAPVRETLAAELDWPGQRPAELLRHRAVVRSGDGFPLAEVVEVYQQGIASGED